MRSMNRRPKKTELTIIILTYNSAKEIGACLDSIYKYYSTKIKSRDWELVVVDNASQDQTLKVVRGKIYPEIRIRENKKNLGFAAANNLAARKAGGEYLLFLNPDTVVESNSISLPLEYLRAHPDVGALTVKILLGNGILDSTCHRGFPTPWNALCYFSGLTKLFPKSRLFAGYVLGHLDLDTPHEVDAINGAYFMLSKKLGGMLGWFDEEFYWKGEDLDLCFRIKERGYKIMYLPQARIHHFKGSSQGHRLGSRTLEARFAVMKLFYDKHYRQRYPGIVRLLVMTGISLRKGLVYLGI